MEKTSIAVEVQLDDAEQLKTDLEAETNNTVQKYTQSNIDGTAATVLLYVQAVSTVISALTPILIHYLKRDSVSKIKVGEVEIDNPTIEQVQALLDRK